MIVNRTLRSMLQTGKRIEDSHKNVSPEGRRQVQIALDMLNAEIQKHILSKKIGPIAVFLIMLAIPVSYADSVSLTTYYPSPTGNYDKLSTNTIVIAEPPVATEDDCQINGGQLKHGSVYFNGLERKVEVCTDPAWKLPTQNARWINGQKTITTSAWVTIDNNLTAKDINAEGITSQSVTTGNVDASDITVTGRFTTKTAAVDDLSADTILANTITSATNHLKSVDSDSIVTAKIKSNQSESDTFKAKTIEATEGMIIPVNPGTSCKGQDGCFWLEQ